MTISIVSFLAERLSEINDDALVAVAAIANVHPGNARRARSGQLVSTQDCLALLAARGFDPVTRKVVRTCRLGNFDHLLLAMGIRMRMAMRKDSIRSAALSVGASATAFTHMRAGRILGIENTLKACAYVGVNPFDQCVLPRSPSPHKDRAVTDDALGCRSALVN